MIKAIKKLKYNKPPKTIAEQIVILISRGLIVADENKLARYLENISYYHLSSYFKAFQKNKDAFDDGVTFDEVLNIYEFDKKLRLLVLDVAERIEKSFKCRMIYNISLKTNDSHWHANPNSYVSRDVFDKYIAVPLDNAQYSNDPDYKKYYEKYFEPAHPPAWTFFEALSFGQSVSFYRNLNTNNKKIIAKTFNIQHYYFTSWMYGMSAIRNISAHHARLWDKQIFASMLLNHDEYKNLFNQDQSKSIYNYLLVAHIFMQKINPTSTWFIKLVNLVKEHKIDTDIMGFPEEWKKIFIAVETIN